MTGRERVMAALNFKQPDIRDVLLWTDIVLDVIVY